MDVRDFRDLLVWQKAMDFAAEVYGLTRRFPDSERYGLCSQLQRSATSVASNLAEGHAIGLPGAFIRHIRIAQGSLAESETQLLLAGKLQYIDERALDAISIRIAEIRRMMTGLKNALERKQSP